MQHSIIRFLATRVTGGHSSVVALSRTLGESSHFKLFVMAFISHISVSHSQITQGSLEHH